MRWTNSRFPSVFSIWLSFYLYSTLQCESIDRDILYVLHGIKSNKIVNHITNSDYAFFSLNSLLYTLSESANIDIKL